MSPDLLDSNNFSNDFNLNLGNNIITNLGQNFNFFITENRISDSSLSDNDIQNVNTLEHNISSSPVSLHEIQHRNTTENRSENITENRNENTTENRPINMNNSTENTIISESNDDSD